ncbi:MAG: hypothetical protein VX955_16145 [Pseudomonadota bacterium]|nr:hypothetical protein [Pseudomonadota bacterium]
MVDDRHPACMDQIAGQIDTVSGTLGDCARRCLLNSFAMDLRTCGQSYEGGLKICPQSKFLTLARWQV